MKVRWRQHEFTLVSIFAVTTVFIYIFRLVSSEVTFAENFKFYKDVLLLQGITLLLQYGCYIWLNKFVIAGFIKPKQRWAAIFKAAVNGDKIPAKEIVPLLLRYLWIAVQLIIIVYLLGPVCNFVSFYCTMPWPDKGIVNSVISILPPHPQPFYNTFGGFDAALFFTCLYLVYAVFREAVIYHIEKPQGRSRLRVLVSNQLTLFGVVYFSIFPFLVIFSSPVPFGLMGQSTFVLYFLVIPATLTVFVANIYWLLPLKGDKPWLKSGITGKLLLLTFICALPAAFLQRAQMVGVSPFIVGNWLVQLFIITPVAWLFYRQGKDKILQLRGVEKALVKSAADLQFLRSQVNPHFLFNALNTLYGTALQEGGERTAEGIQKLGDMMRFMLHENNLDYIPMSREMEYLENYIALQKLRTQASPNIVIEDNIAGQTCSNNIAPMLLIPLVENAFKHGISLAEPSWIKISLACGEKYIRFEVKNSMHPGRNNDPDKNTDGIGLKNVEQRLALLYPGKYAFSTVGDGKEFIAVLELKL